MKDNLRKFGGYALSVISVVALTVMLWVRGMAGLGDYSYLDALTNLYYIPILIAAFLLGETAGVTIGILATAAMVVLEKQYGVAPLTFWWSIALVIRGSFFLTLAYLAGWMGSRIRANAREWQSLLEISHSINSSLDLDETLQVIVRQSVELTSADACAIRLIRDDSEEMIYGKSWGLSEKYLNKGPLMVRDSPMVQSALRGADDTVFDVRTAEMMPYREEMRAEGIMSVLSLPLRVEDRVIGLLNLYRKRSLGFTRRDRRVGRAFAEQAAMAIQNARLYDSIRSNYMATVRALTRAIEARDPMTLGHSERVTELALKMARALGMSPAELQTLEFGAMLHDIGKIGLTEDTLTKTGHLSLDERLLMEMHPMIGRSIIDPIEFLEPCVPMVFSHHERWDGGGYPEGLARTEIPLLARIVAIADAMDHVMYHASPFPIFAMEALEEIRAGAGTKFDPDLVEVLARVLPGDDSDALPEDRFSDQTTSA